MGMSVGNSSAGRGSRGHRRRGRHHGLMSEINVTPFVDVMLVLLIIFMAQEIRRGEETLIAARVEAAIVGESGRPRRFPVEWIAAFLPTGT